MSELLIPPEEIVEIDTPIGRLRLHFSMGAWMRYQRLTGHSILREPLTSAHLADTERCMVLLECGIRAHHPEVTRNELEQHLTLRDMDRILPALQEAIRATSPVAEVSEEDEGEDPRQAQS